MAPITEPGTAGQHTRAAQSTGGTGDTGVDNAAANTIDGTTAGGSVSGADPQPSGLLAAADPAADPTASSPDETASDDPATASDVPSGATRKPTAVDASARPDGMLLAPVLGAALVLFLIGAGFAVRGRLARVD
jgi:hypothetical protein